MAKTDPITADEQVEDLVERIPEAVGLLMRKGIVCITCGEPYWGTLGKLIKEKGLPVEETIAELNEELSPK